MEDRERYLCPECEYGDNVGGECPRCGEFMLSIDEGDYNTPEDAEEFEGEETPQENYDMDFSDYHGDEYSGAY